MEFVILNGEIQERSEAKIDIEDRGYQFGDGVYEVIRVYNGNMFTGKEHLKRLSLSAEKIGIRLPYTIEEMEKLLNTLIEKNQLLLGTVYMQFTRGTSPRNHAFPQGEIPATFVAYTRSVERPTLSITNGVKAILTEDIRWLRCDIKSLNLLGNLLAKQKAAEADCFEAILHRGPIVTEGSSSNITIVKDGVLKTHHADNFILNGITKQKILEICSENEISVEETPFTLDDLRNADEVFLSSTTAEITPIIEVEGHKVKDGAPGPVTRRLQQLFEEEIITQCGALTVNQ